MNRLDPADAPVHEWYRFVLSFPPHLVRQYLDRFNLTPQDVLLDPFCGTGTTLVEAKKHGIPSVGIEATPMAYFASRTKVNFLPEPDALEQHAKIIARQAVEALRAEGIDDVPLDQLAASNGSVSEGSLRSLPPDQMKLLLKNSISPLPLHKTLVLIEQLESLRDDRFYDHERLALANALTGPIGNLHFGPEVGVGKPKPDAAVIAPWLERIRTISNDLRLVIGHSGVPSTVHHADSRDILSLVEPESISALITSPPYPNEKDYTRTTRLETVLLGMIESRADLQALKRTLIRSNTRGVYKVDSDDQFVENHPEIQRIAAAIENRRIELGKTSGFERLYARVTQLYFGGMLRHLESLKRVLRPGAQLAYVVGDQASYLRVMIRTGQILADIAEELGYEVVGIDLFRTRLATATREQLREEVLVLRWPG